MNNEEVPKFEFFGNMVNITGRAIPEFAPFAWLGFLDDLNELLKAYKKIIINFKLDYYNSASSQYLSTMFNSLSKSVDDCKSVVNWFYFPNDETTYENGEMYKEIYNKIEINLKIRHE